MDIEQSIIIKVPTCSASRLGTVWIPPGPVIAGQNKDSSEEKPRFMETRFALISKYGIDAKEVSNEQYNTFVDSLPSEVTVVPRKRRSPSPTIDNPKAGQSKHPVTMVSWYDARDYCLWHGKTLPTFVQFQKAARGDPDEHEFRRYPWGNEHPQDDGAHVASWSVKYRQSILAKENRNLATVEVDWVAPKEAEKSVYHVFNLTGNVGEWLADGEPKYVDRTYQLPNANSIDPIMADPETSATRLYHPGYWQRTYPELAWIGFALARVPSSKMSFVGFRCVSPGSSAPNPD